MKKYIFVLALLLFHSCETPSDCAEYYFSEKFMDIVPASAGSYWIYVDTTLNITDTITLLSQTLFFDDKCTPAHNPQEVLKQIYKSSFFRDDTSHLFTLYGSGQGDLFGDYPIGIYFSHADILDSLNVHGVWYENVSLCKIQENTFYWSSDVGLIKRDFTLWDNPDTAYCFNMIEHHRN